jgi:hypothetical protein
MISGISHQRGVDVLRRVCFVRMSATTTLRIRFFFGDSDLMFQSDWLMSLTVIVICIEIPVSKSVICLFILTATSAYINPPPRIPF